MEERQDLISRRAAIDALKRISFSHWFECGEYLSEDTREIEIINSKKALEVIEALSSAQSELKWIPCSERCPKEEQKEYWICTDTGYQCECRWTNVNHFWTDLTTSWHWHIMDVPQYTKVVAWMSLPKAYLGGDSE